VLALLEDHRPVEVQWNQLTRGDASAELALTVAAAGAPAYAEPGGATESCVESAPWLRVPVEMTLTLAGGEVVAAGTTVLDVGALELARVHLTPGWDLPAELAGVYGTQLGAAYAEAVDTYPADTASLDGVWVVVSRTWDAPGPLCAEPREGLASSSTVRRVVLGGDCVRVGCEYLRALATGAAGYAALLVVEGVAELMDRGQGWLGHLDRDVACQWPVHAGRAAVHLVHDLDRVDARGLAPRPGPKQRDTRVHTLERADGVRVCRGFDGELAP